jgi:hypothetical protein
MAPWVFAAADAVFARGPPRWAEMAYRGQQLRAWETEQCGGTVEIVERPRRWGWSPLAGSRPPCRPSPCCRAGGWWHARRLEGSVPPLEERC